MTVSDPSAAAPTDDTVARGDRAALLACDEPQYRDYLAGVLRAAGLRVHHAAGHTAAIARFSAGRPRYAVVVLIENLENSAGLADNRFLQHLAHLPGSERRELFVALVGQTLATADPDGAFAAGVDASVHYRDVSQFAEVVLPALEERQEADAAWREAASAA